MRTPSKARERSGELGEETDASSMADRRKLPIDIQYKQLLGASSPAA